MILIASSFSLLVIVAGMFLLAKTQKDGLSNMFKYVSYFVIFSGFFSLFGGGTAFIIKRCMMRCQMQNQMQCERNYEHCSHWRHGGEGCGRGEECEEGMKMGHCDGMNEEKCMEKKECCSEMKGEKSGCMKGNMMVKKDSVIIKK
jgi:hypothetical protein